MVVGGPVVRVVVPVDPAPELLDLLNVFQGLFCGNRVDVVEVGPFFDVDVALRSIMGYADALEQYGFSNTALSSSPRLPPACGIGDHR